jgi:SAM-dependent methyltransferase
MNYKDDDLYWKYLNKKTFFGRIYQNYFLYPILKKHIHGKLIDIGAGLGDFCKFYRNSVAADINRHAVENYKKRNINGTLILNDKINFNDSTFDSAILDNVIEHIYDPLYLLEEIKRILKNNGKIIIGVPGQNGFKSDFDHKVFYNEEKLIKLLTKLNFEIQEIFYTPFKSDFLNKFSRLYCLYAVFKLKY